MSKFFEKYPNTSRLLLAGALIIIALFLTSILTIPKLKEIFPFIGVILLVLANWIMFKTENKSLNDIGLNLKKASLYFLPIGLILGVLAVFIGYCLKSILVGDTINLNGDLDYLNVLKHLYWILPTAMVQELICRGYVFNKLISATNLTKANSIMSLVFIAMHDVFGIGIFGAIFYSISLIIGHLVFSSALLKSGTLFFAIGIHWGSNVANNQLFTDDKLNSSLLYLTKIVQEEPTGFNPIGVLLYIIALNFGFILLGIWIWKRKWKKAAVGESTTQDKSTHDKP